MSKKRPAPTETGQTERTDGGQPPPQRRSKKKKKRKNKRGKVKNAVNGGGAWAPDIVKECKGFERYYKAQGDGFLRGDGGDGVGEWAAFDATLRRGLPTTFRINSNLRAEERATIKDRLHGEFTDLFVSAAASATAGAESNATAVTTAATADKACTRSTSNPIPLEENPIAPPTALSWYPEKSECWQLGAQMKQIRKVDALRPCHDFLVRANDVGDISRQEVVSMIPPLLLGVQPHHKVLDMCAAPGSKTIQLVEALCGRTGAGQRASPSSSSLEPHKNIGGFLIANDNNLKRTFMLIHRVQALKNPAFAVTNHEAQSFPTPFARVTSSSNARDTLSPVLFDRILCDVPCSGDGTMRKNPDIWRRWRVTHAMGLHRMQKRIALRGVALLRPGGIMAFSTCSFNPVENEAVVAELLRSSHGELELVNISPDVMPGLRRRPGMRSWRVALASGRMHQDDKKKKKTQEENENEDVSMGTEGEAETGASATPDDATLDFSFVERSDVASNRQNLEESMFPPTSAEANSMHLERCWRMMPHDNDTGGFFVAVLRKREKASANVTLKTAKDDVPATDEVSAIEVSVSSATSGKDGQVPSSSSSSSSSSSTPSNRAQQDPFAHSKADPQKGELRHYVSLTAPCHDKDWDELCDFYGLTLDEDFCRSNFFTQSENASSISWVPTSLKESVMDFTLPRRLNIVRAGLPVFRRRERPGVACKHVLRQDMLDIVLPHLGRRVVTLNSANDMRRILTDGIGGKKTPFEELSATIASQLHALERGSFCFVLRQRDQPAAPAGEDIASSTIGIVAWRANKDVSPTVNKKELKHLLERLDSSNHKF